MVARTCRRCYRRRTARRGWSVRNSAEYQRLERGAELCRTEDKEGGGEGGFADVNEKIEGRKVIERRANKSRNM
jgi:hypothetical protein